MKSFLKKTTIFSIILVLTSAVGVMLPTRISAETCSEAGDCLPSDSPPKAIDSTLQDIGSAINLNIGGVSGDKVTFGVVLSALLPYLYVFGGMILFSMLIWGGFEMLAGAQDTKAQEAGKNRITAAAIGFILLFVSYWLAQLLQFLLGINILGGK